MNVSDFSRREPISRETAIFLIGQHSFDHFVMGDPASAEEYEGIIGDTIDWLIQSVGSGNGVAKRE